MKQKQILRNFFLFSLIYFGLALVFFTIARNELSYRVDSTNMLSPSVPIGELTEELHITQEFTAVSDNIISLDLFVSTYGRENTGNIIVRIFDDANLMSEQMVPVAHMEDNKSFAVLFDEPLVTTAGSRLTLDISSEDGVTGDAISLWYGNGISTGRLEIGQEISAQDCVSVNDQAQNGQLCFRTQSVASLWFGSHFWSLCAIVYGLLLAYIGYSVHQLGKGNLTLLFRAIHVGKKYHFLMKQLVMRDFKTKYKRSALGVLWSFLNPLLTMLVQYLVFSTLFKSDIENFVVYLLVGIVCFSFFSEATSMGLNAIVGNSSLITKVYIPKYIYPVARVTSSGVNLLFSLVPLFITVLLTGTSFTPAALLLVFPLLCLFLFSLGISLILCSSMVFFRDTQFLWGVLSMLWMYLTPIFYPDSIIPAQYLTLYKMNPLYHFIRFTRILLINGTSPEPKAYMLCILATVIPLALGMIIFKKTQNKFILNL